MLNNLDSLSVLGKLMEKSDRDILNKPNVKGVGYRWMFDIDYLTDSMNYIPVSLENQTNPHAGASEVTNSAGPQQEKKASSTDTSEDNPKILAFRRELEEIALKHLGKVSENTSTSTPSVNTGSESVNTGSFDPDDSPMPELEIFHKSETGIFDEASYDEEGVITDFNNLPTEIEVSPTPTLRIHNIHPKSQILGDPKSAVQTRSKVQQKSRAHALFSFIQKQQRNNHKDQQHCLFCPVFYLRRNLKKISKALQDDSWVQAMQEELLQFKLQQVWVLVDLPHGMKVIGTKWVYRNKRDERGVVVKIKARLGAQGKTRNEEVYVSQPPSFVDPDHPKKDFSDMYLTALADINTMQEIPTSVDQFLRQRLISWQCKKQTIVATSTTEAEYVAAANCCGQVLLVTPSKTTVNASRGEQVLKTKALLTLEAAKTSHHRVASNKKPKSKIRGRIIKVSTVSGKVSTISGQVSTDSIKKSIPSPDKDQREGKAPMIIEEAPKKTKKQILQEKASLAEAIRLDTLEKRRIG
ncbi:putative ribonuclease H-like domain-containing protein [Tanacetum coccineum]|uniref:Ribonuclease H-like domain-containing protein n=1 Tax=Tanacetum coccineum TaxID=301880 RepID=A0ABQ5G7D7_9ASTR